MQKTNITTSYREDLHERIPMAAIRLFQQKGVKAVRMDDIANHLQISKRTLYEIYDNKEDLLLEGIKRTEEIYSREMEEFACKNNDVMRIILHFYEVKLQKLEYINPLFFTEMTRYHKVDDYLNKISVEKKQNVLQFFMRGIAEGYFLPSLNYDIVVRLGEASMNYVMNSKLYEEYPLQEIFKNFVSVLLRGYCTEKGQRVLDATLF